MNYPTTSLVLALLATLSVTPACGQTPLPLFVAAHMVSLVVRMTAGAGFPGWGLLIAPFLEALLWPLASFVLLVPQRRAPDRDKNRPL